MEFWGWHFRQLCRHSKPRHFCFSDWRDSNHLLEWGAYTHSVLNRKRYCPQHPPAFSRRAEDHQDLAVPPENFGLIEKIIASTVAVVVPIWGARSWLERRFSKKADKEAVAEEFQEVHSNIGKVFDQIRQNEQRAQDRHERLMELINKG
jgi:hypothetical protein